MNYGEFTKDSYIKKVSFSKAVLWKDRQLSLRKDVINQILGKGIRKIVFVDEVKGEKWEFKSEKVFKDMVLKTVGQESQFYFSIHLAKKIEIPKAAPKPEYIFDKERNCYVQVMPKIEEPIKIEPKAVQAALF